MFVIVIVIIMIYIIIKQMDSHDKRFKQIIDFSIKYNKKTTGEEFNIKPIKFIDELQRTRYRNSNYEEREEDKIVIKEYIDEETYKVYKIDIVNYDGKALLYAKFVKDI